MHIKEKLMDFKNRLSDRHMFSIVITVVAILLSIAIFWYKTSQDYRYTLHNQYRRSFSELAQNVENIESSLAKGVVTTDPTAMIRLASDIYGKAAFASANLGQLPFSEVELEKTSKFLSQVGNYTYSLSLKYLDGNEITNEDHQNLLSLSEHAKNLGESLTKMEAGIYNGTMRFGDIKKAGSALASGKNNISDKMKEVESTFVDYPSLIYDGPFSEHIDLAEPVFLHGKNDVSSQEAQKTAEKMLGKERSGNISYQGECEGKIVTYNFSSAPSKKDKDRSIYVEVTKKGGYPLLMLDNRFAGETKIKIEEAKEKAVEYLKSLGFTGMKESYYEIKSNVATINYAYTQEGATVYPDLAKVKIALDNGEVVGFEGRGYIMSHYKRNIPGDLLPEEEAVSKISPLATVESSKLCVIPLESQREVTCYEIKCSLSDKTFLVYLNAQTGREEDVLLLIESENGTLTL